jgi:hypothetical protein
MQVPVAIDVLAQLTGQEEALPESNQQADTMPDTLPVLLSTARMGNADGTLASWPRSIEASTERILPPVLHGRVRVGFGREGPTKDVDETA